jgi:hypothetical protein
VREPTQVIAHHPDAGLGFLGAGRALERERNGEQTLLRAVVQIAFESPPLGVASFDEPVGGPPQLFLLQPRGGAERFALEGQRGGSGDLEDGRDVRIVIEPCDEPASALDRRARPEPWRRRAVERERLTGLRVGNGDAQAAVAAGMGERGEILIGDF